MQTATTQGIGDILWTTESWRLGIDLLEILIVTVLLILRDLSNRNRPFDWLPIIFTMPFGLLLFIQSLIAAGVLIGLVDLQRARFGGTDAWWVALAGLSILKILPGGGGENPDGTQLGNLLEWLLQKFYGQLALQIRRNSARLAERLVQIYSSIPSEFLKDTSEFIGATENEANAATDQQDVKAEFNRLTDDKAKVQYLANWISPRATRKQWMQLTGRK